MAGGRVEAASEVHLVDYVEFYRPTLLDPGSTSATTSPRANRHGIAWLRRHAGHSRRGNTAGVWMVAEGGQRVACYATSSMT